MKMYENNENGGFEFEAQAIVKGMKVWVCNLLLLPDMKG